MGGGKIIFLAGCCGEDMNCKFRQLKVVMEKLMETVDTMTEVIQTMNCSMKTDTMNASSSLGDDKVPSSQTYLLRPGDSGAEQDGDDAGVEPHRGSGKPLHGTVQAGAGLGDGGSYSRHGDRA